MENEALSKLIPVTVLFLLGIIESIGGLYFKDKRSRNDFSIELLSLLTLPTFIQPGIFLFVLWFMGASFPELEDFYINSSFWWHLVAFLILDDLTQYWWHRLSHINKKMWKLHRPHHVVEEMGVLVTSIILCIYAGNLVFSCFNLLRNGLCILILSAYKINCYTISS